MILRRFMKHVNDQNWFAVGLDVIVVIVGIFLGLQVQEWNEERRQRAQEGEYLSRLLEDIDASIRRNQITLSTFKQQEDYAASMRHSLKTCALDETAELKFINGIYILGKNDPARLVRDVLEDLKSTGNFKILQNRDLREELTAHTAEIDQMILIEAKIYERISPSIRYLDQNVVMNISGPTSGIDVVKKGDIEFDFEALCNDTEFYRAVSHIRSFNFEMIDTIQNAVQDQKNIKRMIELELARFE